jgi:hypothetical protein
MAYPPPQFSEEHKNEIIRRLRDKGVRGECPMCGHKNFALAEGYFNHPIQTQLGGGLVLGGPTIPTVAIICTNCGFTSQHALGALGLLKLASGEG